MTGSGGAPWERARRTKKKMDLHDKGNCKQEGEETHGLIVHYLSRNIACLWLVWERNRSWRTLALQLREDNQHRCCTAFVTR